MPHEVVVMVNQVQICTVRCLARCLQTLNALQWLLVCSTSVQSCGFAGSLSFEIKPVLFLCVSSEVAKFSKFTKTEYRHVRILGKIHILVMSRIFFVWNEFIISSSSFIWLRQKNGSSPTIIYIESETVRNHNLNRPLGGSELLIPPLSGLLLWDQNLTLVGVRKIKILFTGWWDLKSRPVKNWSFKMLTLEVLCLIGWSLSF